MYCKTRTRLLLGGMAALACTVSYADEYHYNNTLIGDRASGMGGAYTAVSDDPAGLYYNPAGIVYAGQRNLSASVNSYHETVTVYKDVFDKGSDWVRRSSNILPNFFGVTQPLGKGTLGFSYAISDSTFEDQDQTFHDFGVVDIYNINFNNSDQTYKLGPSYALAVGEKFSMGLTLYAHMRRRETITNQWVRYLDGRYEWSNRYQQFEETGFTPILGVMWSPQTQFSIGMTIRQTLIMDADNQYQHGCVSNIDPNVDPQCNVDATEPDYPFVDPQRPRDPQAANDNEKRNLPFTTSIGVAYFPSDRLIVSGDFVYYADTPDDNKVATWNAAGGIEYYYSDTKALRAGIFSNRANTPQVLSEPVFQGDHIDMYGLSMSLTNFTRASSLTGGFSWSQGSGETRIFGDDQVQTVEGSTTVIYLSATYSY